MTEEQRLILRRLERVSMPVASYDKRFRRAMREELELTERQAAYLLKLDHRYRRQTNGLHRCTALCATYQRRATGECFEAPLPPKPVPAFTRADERAANSLGITLREHAHLPLFDGERA